MKLLRAAAGHGDGHAAGRARLVVVDRAAQRETRAREKERKRERERMLLFFLEEERNAYFF